MEKSIFLLPLPQAFYTIRKTMPFFTHKRTEINFEEYRKSDKLKAWKNYTSWQSILRR